VPSKEALRLFAPVLAATLMPLNSTMVAVAVPEISADFGHDPAVVTQALVTSYLVGAVVLQSPAGKIGDRIGHGRMIMVGQLLVGAGAVLGFLAPALAWLIIARILMAAGSAALVPSTLALMRQVLAPERRGRAYGTFGALMALSAAVGPLVGGELVRLFGWQSVFAANLPVLVVAVALGALTGSFTGAGARVGVATGAGVAGRRAPARFDWVGTVLLAGGLTVLIVGLRPGAAHEVVLLALGGGLLVAFALWERRVEDPVIAFSLFRSRHFSAGAVLISVQNLVMYTLIFQVPLLGVALFDLGAEDTGRLLLSLTLAMMLTSPLAGRLTDHLGSRRIGVAGSLVALLGLADLARIDLTSASQLVIPLAMLGVGVGLTTPAAQSASMTAASTEAAGMAAGIGSTMRYLGGIVGVAVMSRVLDVHAARAAVISDHHALLVFFAGALVVGLGCAAVLPDRSSQPDEVPEVRHVRRPG
jgi:MFS family permease